MSQTCVQFFCGCQYYLGEQQSISAKVYVSIGLMLLILTICVRIGSEWFIFKDYYPMKQRSPVLCIMMITCIAVQLIMYPLAYTYNYFTRNWSDFVYTYRTVFYAFQGSLYLLYVIRALRLVYAHEIDNSRRNTWVFKFMKNEYFLVGFMVVVTVVKIIPVLVSNVRGEDNIFFTFIDVNTFTFSPDETGISRELGFGIKQTIHEFVWLSAIVYCLWLQTLVHQKYSMKAELLMVLGIGFAFNLSSIILYVTKIGEPSIIVSICNDFQSYPLLQMLRDLNVLGYFLCSIVFPLFRKRIYHMLLPTGRHHDIVKTMRDFLMESEFIEIFQEFLRCRDDEEGSVKYLSALDYWKRLMIIKFKATNKLMSVHHRFECLQELKDLVRSIEDRPIKQIHANLINNLKQSIISLQSCDEGDENEERERYLQQINLRIEELQQIFLQKLDYIYKTEYRQTKSYYFLKMYTMRNKKININMITLGMAVMVESEDVL